MKQDNEAHAISYNQTDCSIIQMSKVRHTCLLNMRIIFQYGNYMDEQLIVMNETNCVENKT